MKQDYKEKLGKINRILQNKKINFEFEDYKGDFSESIETITKDFEKSDTEFYSTEVNLRDALEQAEKLAKDKDEGISEIDFSNMADEDFDADFFDFIESRINPWLDEAEEYLAEGFEFVEDKMSEDDLESKKELLEALEESRETLMKEGIKERDLPAFENKMDINDIIQQVDKISSDVKEAMGDVAFAEQERDELEIDEDDEEGYEEEYDRLNEELREEERRLEDLETEMSGYFNDIEMQASDLKENLDKITEARENFHALIIDHLMDIKSNFESLLDILGSYNEDYVNTNAMNFLKYSDSDNLENFIKKKEINENITDELVVSNKGMKLNHLLWFDDDSVLFLNNEQKPFSLNNDTQKDIVSFCESIIEHELRKMPKWKPVFDNYFKEHCEKKGFPFSDIIENIEGLKQYNNVFKQEKIEPYKMVECQKSKELKKVQTYKNLEKFIDALDEIKKKSAINKIVKGIFTGKYKSLLNEESYGHFEAWYDNGIDEKIIKNELAGKIAAFKDSDSLNSAFKKITNHLLGWGAEFYTGKANKCNAEILYKSEDSLIVKIPNYKASREMGSQSWCISRTESMFNSYTAKGDQYFVYDFKRPPEDVRSLVGITLNSKMGEIRASHLKNDKSVSAPVISDLISNVLVNEDNPNPDFFANSLHNFANYYPSEFMKFWEKNKEVIKTINFNKESLEKIISPLSPEQIEKMRGKSERKRSLKI